MDDNEPVETNTGSVPYEDYPEIAAAQHGFDSYAEMPEAGIKISV